MKPIKLAYAENVQRIQNAELVPCHVLYAIHTDNCGDYWKEVRIVYQGEDLQAAREETRNKYGSCMTVETEAEA